MPETPCAHCSHNHQLSKGLRDIARDITLGKCLIKCKVAETALTEWPATTSRTAGARRKTRASFVCWSTVAKGVNASSCKWLLRGRIAGRLGMSEGHPICDRQ